MLILYSRSRAPRVLPDERAPGRYPQPAEEDGGLRHEGHLGERLQLRHLRLPLHHQLLQQQGRRHRGRARRRTAKPPAAGDLAAEGVGAAVGPAAAAAAAEQPAARPEGARDEEALHAEEDHAAALKYVDMSECNC